VELGKALAKTVLADVAAGEPSAGLDPSTAELMKRLMV
jgi:glucose-6-phosphate isomerase